MNDSASSASGQNARPVLGTDNIHDVDAAQHFLADHAASIIVAFDHDAMDPAVNIYTATPGGALSPGDYYLWPLLHRTSERLRQEIGEIGRSTPGYSWRMDARRLTRWQRRRPLLTTLIRIRKATIHALCRWDLTGSRPESLTVLNTRRDLTGLTMDQVSGQRQLNFELFRQVKVDPPSVGDIPPG